MENKRNYEAPAALVVELHLEKAFCIVSVRMNPTVEEDEL